MKNLLSVSFAGQAGFIFETESGVKIGVDLYLSDCCFRYFGFKRLLPYIYDPSSLKLDYIVATHAHYDHFDPDSMPLLTSNGNTKLICALDCIPELERLNIPKTIATFIRPGDTVETPDFTLIAVPCDHGPQPPHAVGILLKIGGKKIYIAGDTAFRADNFSNPVLSNPDLFIFPINGAFGNMNEREGAEAAKIVNPKLAVPCHYWNFAEHGGNPQLFSNAMASTKIAYSLMRPGETINI
ncbi:MAG: MBL fold metallo-hydrolase [Oscillospiraceae bacterium]|nr:MBL fold metallo-hydrolase [Oscillospiraceae bacterium]